MKLYGYAIGSVVLMFISGKKVQYFFEISFLRQVPLFSLLGVHSMVTIATVCQSKLSLVSPSGDLTIGTKIICVQQTGKFFKF